MFNLQNHWLGRKSIAKVFELGTRVYTHCVYKLWNYYTFSHTITFHLCHRWVYCKHGIGEPFDFWDFALLYPLSSSWALTSKRTRSQAWKVLYVQNVSLKFVKKYSNSKGILSNSVKTWWTLHSWFIAFKLVNWRVAAMK